MYQVTNTWYYDSSDGVVIFLLIILHKSSKPYCNFFRLKPNAEQQFLYGHNVTKAGLGRITENTDKYSGVVVYSMNDLPLGFGVAAKSTGSIKFLTQLVFDNYGWSMFLDRLIFFYFFHYLLPWKSLIKPARSRFETFQ